MELPTDLRELSQLQSEMLIGNYRQMTYREIEEELDQLKDDYDGTQAANLRIRVVAALHRKAWTNGGQSQRVEAVDSG